jgi:hypothetical protein
MTGQATAGTRMMLTHPHVCRPDLSIPGICTARIALSVQTCARS